MFPYSDFVVNDENGNRIGIGRVFSVESFEKELFAFRPSPMLTAISQEDGKSVVPISALYWTQHANFVTRGVEGIIVNRMRERMEDDKKQILKERFGNYANKEQVYLLPDGRIYCGITLYAGVGNYGRHDQCGRYRR